MSVALPTLQVGEPVCYNNLSVFPLFAETQSRVDYRLSGEALADASVLVEELTESGSVPELSVENKSDGYVLFLEGEELIGAKQNRILNTSVLVAPHSKIKIPVSCVEQGRWGYTSRHFGSSGSHSSSKLRRALKASVSKSTMSDASHRSNQGEVWAEVECLQQAHSVDSRTAAMSDVYLAHGESISEYQNQLTYVEGAIGAAIAVGDKVVMLDVFDKPQTCAKVWPRMLTGVVFDALEAGEAGTRPSTEVVQHLLQTANESTWQQAPAVGEGEEFRAESPRGDHLSVLVFDGTIVHGNVMTAV